MVTAVSDLGDGAHLSSRGPRRRAGSRSRSGLSSLYGDAGRSGQQTSSPSCANLARNARQRFRRQRRSTDRPWCCIQSASGAGISPLQRRPVHLFDRIATAVPWPHRRCCASISADLGGGAERFCWAVARKIRAVDVSGCPSRSCASRSTLRRRYPPRSGSTDRSRLSPTSCRNARGVVSPQLDRSASEGTRGV